MPNVWRPVTAVLICLLLLCCAVLHASGHWPARRCFLSAPLPAAPSPRCSMPKARGWATKPVLPVRR